MAQTRGMADGIAALLFPYAEVVVHDLRTQSVVYLANNLSHRQVGDASALERAELKPRTPVIGPYYKRNYDGSRMRSVSIVVGSPAGDPIGLVCINLNVAVFEQAQAALSALVSGVRQVAQPKALFQDDWQERINTFIHAWVSTRGAALNLLTRDQKKELVQDLFNQGAFGARSAADYIARVLNMGRATVFKHAKAVKDQTLHTARPART